jgi:hypothetical protein
MSWNRGFPRILINAAKPENIGRSIKVIIILRFIWIVLSTVAGILSSPEG